jgi:hypothetical protein
MNGYCDEILLLLLFPEMITKVKKCVAVQVIEKLDSISQQAGIG